LLFIFVIFSWPFNYLASGSLDETKCWTVHRCKKKLTLAFCDIFNI
jgi:hypothetical protein